MDTKTKIKAIDKAIAALKDAAKFTDMGFDFDGDVFGFHHNDAVDALDDYANAIADLKTLRDAINADMSEAVLPEGEPLYSMIAQCGGAK